MGTADLLSRTRAGDGEALVSLADPTGELWLHQLGLPLATGGTDAWTWSTRSVA